MTAGTIEVCKTKKTLGWKMFPRLFRQIFNRISVKTNPGKDFKFQDIASEPNVRESKRTKVILKGHKSS